MASKFLMVKDAAGLNSFGLKVPALAYFQGIMTANSEQTATVPSDPLNPNAQIYAIFSSSPGSAIWVAYNVTATVPSGALAQHNSELNPTVRLLNPGDVIHLITNDASDEIGIVFYSNY